MVGHGGWVIKTGHITRVVELGVTVGRRKLVAGSKKEPVPAWYVKGFAVFNIVAAPLVVSSAFLTGSFRNVKALLIG